MLLIFFLGLGASSAFFYLDVIGTQHDIRERTLQGQARDLLSGMHADATGSIEFTEPADWVSAYAEVGSDFAYTLYGPDGQQAASSANLSVALPRIDVPEDENYSSVQFSGVGDDRRVLLAARAPGGYRLIVARAHSDPETLAESILFEEDYEQLLVFLPFVLGSILLIWLISGHSLQPLERASREASSVGPANPTARIGTAGLPSEVLPLVNAVNAALDRLATAYVAEQRLTADAAHELRTPLAVLSLHLQRARQGNVDWRALEQDTAQLTRIVGQLMNLARKESAVLQSETEIETVNLARLAREAAAQVLPLAEAAERSLQVEAPETLPIKGQRDDLRDMIVNLLDNALTHGRGAISLRLTRGTEAGITLEVEDEGPGIPEALKESAFDRFRKGLANSPGAGLGLAIVRQTARNHGGEAFFVPNAGSMVRITLPA